jgi:hypothetical protein
MRAGVACSRMAAAAADAHSRPFTPSSPPPPPPRAPPAGTQTEAFVDFVVGHGELWSAQLMAAACQQMVRRGRAHRECLWEGGNLKQQLQCEWKTQTPAAQCVRIRIRHTQIHPPKTKQGADAVFMDTRDVLVVSPTSDGTSVDLDEEASNKKLDAWFNQHGKHKIVIATGFIAKNKE